MIILWNKSTPPDDVKGYVVGQFKKAANSKFIRDNQSLFKFDILAGGKNLFEQQLKKLVL